MSEADPYDIIVIGGGPSALSESLRLRERFERVLVVSDRFGGCLEIMGDMQLQSYLPELAIAGAPRDISEFMRSSLDLRPTGREYANYIKKCFESSLIETRLGTVDSLSRDKNGFLVAGHRSSQKFTLRARRVVLATGLRPKTPTIRLQNGNNIGCFQTYAKLAKQEVDCFRGCFICIVGSGNSAYQLAYSMARFASCITILAKHYPGFYPMESEDRFALRALSLPTIEMVQKTAEVASQAGPINAARCELAPIFLHIYDTLWEDQQTGKLCARLPSSRNSTPLLSRSSKAASLRGLISSCGSDSSIWRHNLSNLLLVHAIGVQANMFEIPWPDLLDDETRFIRHHCGRTAVEGLYVAGSAAGYPSVNRMQPIGQII